MDFMILIQRIPDQTKIRQILCENSFILPRGPWSIQGSPREATSVRACGVHEVG
jgi:hypothetical protein